jgi:EAL domain-containing protein (putative c-di-GMP-specific phosphodiesterase class I)
MEPVRAQAVSLHDENGDLLWLTESSMGPDEHNAVQQAFESFASGSGPTAVAYDLGDSRSAVLFRVTDAKRAMVGAAMVIVDTRAVNQGERGAGQLLTQKLLRALGNFAVTRRRMEPAPAPAPAPAPKAPPASLASVKPAVKAVSPPPKVAPKPPVASSPVARPAAPDARPAVPVTRPAAPVARAAPATPATPAASAVPPPSPPPTAPRKPSLAAPDPREADVPTHDIELPELTLTPMSELNIPGKNAPARAPSPAAPPASSLSTPAPIARVATPENITPEIDRLNAALRNSPIALYVQRLMPLTKGSTLKRFEVLLRSKGEEAAGGAPQAMLKAAVDHGLGSMIDRRVITELVGWLVKNPRVCEEDDVRFSVNLTKTALHDEHFMKFISMCLAKAALPPQTIAFEIDVALAIKAGMRMTEVAAGLHRLGCPLVLDDFGLRTECFELLRLPGVKYIKLDPSITTQMRTDKVSQAAITALVQMARVLGLHTVAKRTETGAEQEWMTALGVDFIQSNALSPPVPIESLAQPANLRQAP